MASQSSDANGIPSGQLKPQSTWGEFNNIAFMVQQALAKMQTSTLVRIESCTNEGGLFPVGYVDVTPMVNQLDGQGNPTPHVTIYGLPYFRLQGGTNGIIIDPEPGDIGVAVFSSRDISQVKTTKKQGNPGSHRQYSFADGMYLGGMLNGTPTQYVQFSAAGIRIHSPTAVILEAPKIQIKAGERFSWDVNGFGEQWKFVGGTTWEHRTWQIGATINNVTGPINPPDGTPT